MLFIYAPKSGSRVVAANPTKTDGVVRIRYDNGSEHWAGVFPAWSSSTAHPGQWWRHTATIAAKAIVQQLGGVATDDQGTVTIWLPLSVAQDGDTPSWEKAADIRRRVAERMNRLRPIPRHAEPVEETDPLQEALWGAVMASALEEAEVQAEFSCAVSERGEGLAGVIVVQGGDKNAVALVSWRHFIREDETDATPPILTVIQTAKNWRIIGVEAKGLTPMNNLLPEKGYYTPSAEEAADEYYQVAFDAAEKYESDDQQDDTIPLVNLHLCQLNAWQGGYAVAAAQKACGYGWDGEWLVEEISAKLAAVPTEE